MLKFGTHFSQLPLFPVLMLVRHRFVLSLILLLINHFSSHQQEILAPMPSCEMIHYFHFHIHLFFFFFLEPNDLLPTLLPVILAQHPNSDLHLSVTVRFRPCSPNQWRQLKFACGCKWAPYVVLIWVFCSYTMWVFFSCIVATVISNSSFDVGCTALLKGLVSSEKKGMWTGDKR